MQQEWVVSRHGYRIACRNNWDGQNQVAIVCHGFGSSKNSPMVQALDQTLPAHGIGVYSFDFPAHGESPVGEEGLRVPFCIDDLAEVEAHLLARNPQAEISYFASSFGAYITLLYLAQHPHRQRKAFLRSAAVTMPALAAGWLLNQRAQEDLARQGYFVPQYDYVREMRITPAFLDDLAEYNLFTRYRQGSAQVAMVHGGQDQVAPVKAAQRFATRFGAQLTILPQGGTQPDGAGRIGASTLPYGGIFARERCGKPGENVRNLVAISGGKQYNKTK